jgi:hypothetical protein
MFGAFQSRGKFMETVRKPRPFFWRVGRNLGRRRFLLFSLVIWGFCLLDLALVNPARAQPDPIIILDDPGGPLRERVSLIEHLSGRNVPIEITGRFCASACTLYLALPQTCVGRQTQFGFHGPSSPIYGISLVPEAFEHWSLVMADHYPAPLREWYLQTGRHVTTGMHIFTGADLIRFGIPEC